MERTSGGKIKELVVERTVVERTVVETTSGGKNSGGNNSGEDNSGGKHLSPTNWQCNRVYSINKNMRQFGVAHEI